MSIVGESPSFMVTFAHRLRDLLFYSGKSAQTVSELCGLAPSTVGRYISGKREPTVGALISIADYFGVSVDWLLGRESVEK